MIKGVMILAIVVGTLIISGCARKEPTKEEIARLEKEKIPKLYSKAGGCEVYRFAVIDSNNNINRYAYFTKCENKAVRTDDSFQKCHTETSGKTRREVCTTIDNSVGDAKGSEQ